jgi:2'-5' RNA ligase
MIPDFGPRRYTPHLTLAYGRPVVPLTPLTEPISWTVEDFVLVRSFQGQSRYERLERYRLSG